MKRAASLEPLELATMGRKMLQLARGLSLSARHGSSDETAELQPIFYNLARDELAERQSRRKQFGQELFGEPAWEMLLHLYVARVEGISLATKAVLASSGAPSTTALRHLSLLEAKGLIRRMASQTDQRVILIELTEQALKKFQRYFLSRLDTAPG